MKDLKKGSFDICSIETLVDNLNYDEFKMKNNLPRINFKKVKLTKLHSLEEILSKSIITKEYLTKNIIKINFPVFREIKDVEHQMLNIKPLRKKKELDELPKEQKIVLIDSTQASRSTDVLNLIWPPKIKEDKLESKEFSKDPEEQSRFEVKKVSKEKPYFIKEEPKKEQEEPEGLEKTKEPIDKARPFPWISQGDDYMGLDSVFGSGLESELVDLPDEEKLDKPFQLPFSESKKESEIDVLYKEKEKEEPISTYLFKAFKPQINIENVSSGKEQVVADINETEPPTSHEKKIIVKNNFFGKAEDMLDKLKSIKVSPLRVVIWGGLACTVGYLLISRYMPDSFNYFVQEESGKVLIDRPGRKKLVLKKDAKKQVLEKELTQSESLFNPISEDQRNTLIEKARQALQGKTDPFGLESFLPPPQLEVSKKEDKSAESQEISAERKQLELVGIIGAQNKNLALVNVYTASYTVLPIDDNEIRANKLKLALSKAVPNRYEVSVLDPIEDWYVKLISKGKARTDDPVIELVKGDKKFSVKVGQKVLLPEEKPLPEPVIDELNE